MRGTNGDYLAGIDGSSADHRDYDAGVDDNLVCSRRSVCISDSVARIESGNPDWRFCSCICCTAVFHKTMGCEVSEYQNGQDDMILVIVLIIILLLILASCLKIVPQAHAYVIERLGAYQGTWSVGFHIKMPIIDKVAKKVILKEQVVDFAPQPVITKDNVTMRIDTVVFYQITDPKLYCYGVQNPIMAIENLTATTLRNIIGDLELDETLTSREIINAKMRSTLDEATDPWGIKVNRVELKNIIPPSAIQDAMEKQMKAERERRESILIAEGEKRSAILKAEGHKESFMRKL